jgi:GT2 family glycosyltransferase
MDLSIIIVNWNSKDYLRQCLRSIDAQTNGLALEIIVIDGASHDGCGEMLAREFPAVRFIQSEVNGGFAKANNTAFAAATAPTILFLNPDTELQGPAINTLYEAFQKLPQAGLLGAKLLNSDGSIQTSCIEAFPTPLNQLLDAEVLRRSFPRLPLWGMAPLYDTCPNAAEVQTVSGACMLMGRELFRRVRGFDEGYFMYAEDRDLCYKVWKAGFKCYYLPTAVLVHHGGGSTQSAESTFSIVMQRAATNRFIRLHQGRAAAVIHRLFLMGAALIRLPLAALFSLFQSKQSAARTSPVRKWAAILRWALGLERWTKRYGASSAVLSQPAAWAGPELEVGRK